MRIDVVCVGRLKEKYWRDAAQEYLKRLTRYGRVEVIEVPDQPAAERLSQAQEMQVMEAEGEKILSRIKPDMHIIALDGRGKVMDSPKFSEFLMDLEQQGRDVAFVIGGSLGLSPQVLKAAKTHISLGSMTWPHQIARILVLEQIYRGYRIARNEPYHK